MPRFTVAQRAATVAGALLSSMALLAGSGPAQAATGTYSLLTFPDQSHSAVYDFLTSSPR